MVAMCFEITLDPIDESVILTLCVLNMDDIFQRLCLILTNAIVALGRLGLGLF